MAIFNSALQTLSEMAIMESEVPEKASPDITDELKAQLAEYPYLNESECKFRVEMVPVKESKRLGKYLIEAEDLSRYMITNSISSAKQAIGNILHFNGLDDEFYHTAIVVDEDSILDEIDNLGQGVAGEDPKQSTIGLNKPMIGEVQTDFSKIRRISNTKRLLDILTNRYGLPIVKKNYTQVGFLESDDEEDDDEDEKEDVELKKKSDKDVVINEKDKEKCDDDDDEECDKDDKKCKDKEECDDKKEVEESTSMDQHELYLQHLRDIAAGKFDNEL